MPDQFGRPVPGEQWDPVARMLIPPGNPANNGRPMMNAPAGNHEATDGKSNFAPMGQQYSASWPIGDTSTKPIVTSEPNDFTWRVSVFGEVSLTIEWGTSSTNQLAGIRAPFLAAIPGRFSIRAAALDPANGASCLCTLTQGTADFEPCVRQFINAPQVLSPYAFRATALFTPTNITIAGVPVVLNAGDSIPLVARSQLTAGIAILQLGL